MAQLSELPEGIFSLLDTDLYKLTMQCAILKYLPAIRTALKIQPVCQFLTHSRSHLCIHQPHIGHAPEQGSIPVDPGTSRQYAHPSAGRTSYAYTCR